MGTHSALSARLHTARTACAATARCLSDHPTTPFGHATGRTSSPSCRWPARTAAAAPSILPGGASPSTSPSAPRRRAARVSQRAAGLGLGRIRSSTRRRVPLQRSKGCAPPWRRRPLSAMRQCRRRCRRRGRRRRRRVRPRWRRPGQSGRRRRAPPCRRMLRWGVWRIGMRRLLRRRWSPLARHEPCFPQSRKWEMAGRQWRQSRTQQRWT
mmetsp:Transcript_17514/g.51809  ORF Transcript_17514/g.51809 Transcript_17514/m.51809 type:complete len:211 (+) Transcript_17514:200-832(+)